MPRNTRKHRKSGGALQDVLPTTSWGQWANYPGALAWSATTQAPPPLANNGLYTGPQSTGEWASKPFPATQYAEAVEAAKVANNPEVFYHQRPNDNNGASFSPYVGQAISNQHWSATAGKQLGGRRKNRKTQRKPRRNSRRKNNRK
jgi:hypothetical protein